MIPRRKIDIQKGEFYKIIKLLFKSQNHHYLHSFEHKFANYIDVKHAIAVSSGRHAMKLILNSLNLNKGDEIIVPAYTLKDLIPIIQSLDLIVVTADIDINTFNIDSHSIKKKITKRTKVILVTHMFGSPCRIDEIMKLAKKHSLYVIEDCAHSVGSEFKGEKTGSFGDAAFFSFEPMKMINTYGGGMIVTNNSNLFNKIQQTIIGYKTKNWSIIKKVVVTYLEDVFLPTFFSYPFLYFLASRWKKKMVFFYRLIQGHPNPKTKYTEIQAFLGIEKLKTLKKRIAKRRKQARLFSSLFNNFIKPQKIENNIVSNYYFFVVLLPGDITKKRKFLLKKGIDAGIHDEITDDCSALLNQNCPNASYVFKHAIHLPLYENISKEKIKFLTKFLNKRYSY